MALYNDAASGPGEKQACLRAIERLKDSISSGQSAEREAKNETPAPDAVSDYVAEFIRRCKETPWPAEADDILREFLQQSANAARSTGRTAYPTAYGDRRK